LATCTTNKKFTLVWFSHSQKKKKKKNRQETTIISILASDPMEYLKYLGAATAVYLGYKLMDLISFFLLPAASLSRYMRQETPWALVTGASAGIGHSVATELAGRGFNIILHGRRLEVLEAAAEQIRSESQVDVKIIVLDAARATSEEIEVALKPCASLPLTVLVNNVGGFPMAEPKIRSVFEYSGADLDHNINLNARFMAQVTRVLCPILVAKGPSLIINISSAGWLGMPGISPYSAGKGFVMSFTRAIAREAVSNGHPLDVLAIVPGDVRSQANHHSLSPGTPTSDQYAKAILDRAPRAISRGWYDCIPWWSHVFALGILQSVPSSVATSMLITAFKQKKEAAAKIFSSKED
jgi:17beta-estradiol 17-dehydrogenase / very-long-chain 3-oxoacyl-CoA reductase